MSKNTITKLVVYNLVVALTAIVLFSPGLLNLFGKATGLISQSLIITLLLMIIFVFIYLNYSLLFAKKDSSVELKAETMRDVVKILNNNTYKKSFGKTIKTLINQIDSYTVLKDDILEDLEKRFDKNSLSYSKFYQTIQAMESVYFDMMKRTATKIENFNEDSYNTLKKEDKNRDDLVIDERLEMYQKYLSDIETSIEQGDKILLRLDKCMFELCKLDNAEGDLDNMLEIKHLDELINNIKHYK